MSYTDYGLPTSSAKEKEVKVSLADLDFKGWIKFIQESYCILMSSAVYAFIPLIPAFAILATYTNISGGLFALYLTIIYVISYMLSIIISWYISCRKCKQCSLQSICKNQLNEKKRLAHADYLNDRKTEIDAVHQEINRLRVYMDKLLSFDNKSQMVRDEVDRTLKQIAMYEEMVARYEKEIANTGSL